MLFAVSIILAGCSVPGFVKTVRPEASQGVIVLTAVDFEKDNPVKLDGSWEFYWNQLLEPKDFLGGKPQLTGYIDVPKSWNGYTVNGKKLDGTGFATYRLLIRLKNESRIYGLKVLPMGCEYKLWVNGEMMSSNGKVGKNGSEASAQYLTKELFFNSAKPEIELILQISNFQHQKGGFWYSMSFGSVQKIESSLLLKFWFEIFLLGALFIFGIYHFGLYILRRKERSPLYFALFCLLVCIRNLTFNEYIITRLFNNLNWDLVIKTEYLSLYLILPVGLAFFSSLFQREFSLKLVRGIQVIALLFCAFVLISPPSVFSYTVDVFLYLLFGGMLYIFYALLRAVLNKKEGAAIVLFGYSILMITGINDIISKFISVNIGLYFSLGLFVFTFTQSFMLSKRFSKTFSSVETLSENLLTYSKELEGKNLLLEKVDKIKDEFLANTTHELKTPLHGIIGIAESITEGAGGRTGERLEESLRIIIESARRLSNLVNDILDFSKMKYQDIHLNIIPVDAWQVTELVLALMRPLAKVKQLSLKNEIPEDVPLISADEDRLKQILQNLIGNAIKFSDDGEIRVYACARGEKLEISVSDMGIGIPHESLDDIFKPFEQLLPPEGGSNGGVGLGLDITKKLVELHGGVIKVQSEPGRGSVFTFAIPLSGVKREEEKYVQLKPDNIKHTANDQVLELPAAFRNPGKPAATVLIADDEPVNLQVMLNIFLEEEYNVITASNGIEALKKATELEKPDLVILDIMMPKMSGLDVCRNLRSRFSHFELPVLVITARSGNNDVLSCFEAGANDFLSKPFNRKEFLARTKTLIELKKAVEKAVAAELNFLQAQIKPHFIYNTMNSIIALCRMNPERAREILLEFSNYLRATFDFKSTEKFVTVEQELSLVKSYLNIETERFSQRLSVQYDLDENISIAIPPLVLQPIVENAVRHGLMTRLEGGTIKISVKSAEEYIMIKVEDNGAGIDKERLTAILEGKGEYTGTGVGLKNINKRLSAIYGYGLDIQSDVGKGTSVSIKILKRRL